MNKPTLATLWLDGCSGCHMSFLDTDENILEILNIIDLVYSPIIDIKEFPQNVDFTLVEGAVNTVEDAQKIEEVRRKTKTLIAFGDCAVTGNVPSLRNPFGKEDTIKVAYSDEIMNFFKDGGLPEHLPKAIPLNKVVEVDYFIPGCPPPANAIYNILKGLISGSVPVATEWTRFGR